MIPFGMIPGGAGSSYQITNSVRLRASASAYFSRTPGSTTNQKTWTFSTWMKRSAFGTTGASLICAGPDSANATELYFSSDSLVINSIVAAGSQGAASTPAVLRDPSAWYHILLSMDTTQSSFVNGWAKIWINGVQQTLTQAQAPVQNHNTWMNLSTTSGFIGASRIFGNYFDGYRADTYFIDGQALTPSSFGQTDSNGVWVPKAYTGTYGNNGFHLDFKDANLTAGSNVGLGKDVSGNGNYWNTNNISVTAGVTYDSMVDTPTNNYATLNPIVASAANISYAALRSGTTAVQGTMEAAVFAGAYWEVTAAGSAVTAGVISGTGTTNTTTVTANKVFGFRLTGAGALDYINITDVGSWTGITTGLTAQQFPYGITQAADWNFGQRPFIGTASGKALCTANLPAVAIPNPSKQMAVNTRNGTGTDATKTGLLFQPDLVWVKARSAATDHKLTDAVRGVTKALISDTTGAETTDANGVKAFTSDGYTVGSDTNYNNSTGPVTYVDWLWKAGGTPVANNVGTISTNQTAGFSIMAWSHTSGAADTVNHGLGATPDMLIWKERNASANNWFVQHKSLSGGIVGGRCLYLNSNVADAANYVFSAANSTSITFIAGSATATMMAYAFREIAGFSKFGSYTGNSSADGQFVYCGFRPKYVLIKDKTATAHWFILDAARNTYNQMDIQVEPNLSNAEAVGATIDCMANGFKPRTTGGGINVTGSTYIFAAFAEFPFGGSNVSPAPAR